jgi:membrane-associated PAP2 superfamily phosphatase
MCVLSAVSLDFSSSINSPDERLTTKDEGKAFVFHHSSFVDLLKHSVHKFLRIELGEIIHRFAGADELDR